MAEIGASSYRRFLQGEKISLEDFIVQYSDDMVRFAYSFVRNSAVAEDVAAEAIACFYLKAKTFPDETHMRAYLYKIVRNKAMDHMRRHRHDVPLEDVENILYCGSLEDDAIQKERDAVLYRCMAKLPPQYAQVLQLAYLEQIPIRDVCSVMKQSAKQVYNLLARAKTSLRTVLEQEGITYEELR